MYDECYYICTGYNNRRRRREVSGMTETGKLTLERLADVWNRLDDIAKRSLILKAETLLEIKELTRDTTKEED